MNKEKLINYLKKISKCNQCLESLTEKDTSVTYRLDTNSTDTLCDSCNFDEILKVIRGLE